MAGILYVVATPIGNLGDITFRAVETLKNSDLIACEDTRQSEKLLSHFNFRKPLLRYDEHVHHPVSEKILRELEEGKNISLITDAGTPGISDPGFRLVQKVVEKGIKVVPIPGPSSVVAALSVSGFLSDSFLFLGFLPRRPGRAKRLLQEGLGLGKTAVLLESPFRVHATLKLIQESAPKAHVVVGREMTKIYEEFIRGDIETVVQSLSGKTLKGEVVIVIKPGDEDEPREEI